MAVVAVLGGILAWVRSQRSFDYALIVVSHSVVAWGLGFAMSAATARALGPVVRGRRLRWLVWGQLALVVSASLYLAWGHYRATHSYVSGLDHALPYPDPAINALERWFDARRPVSPGNLKLHGEYPLVGFILGMLVLIHVSLAGLLLGLISKRPR